MDSSILAILWLSPEKSCLISSSLSKSFMFFLALICSRLAVNLSQLNNSSMVPPELVVVAADRVLRASRVAGARSSLLNISCCLESSVALSVFILPGGLLSGDVAVVVEVADMIQELVN